jgi:hypothetical protein
MRSHRGRWEREKELKYAFPSGTMGTRDMKQNTISHFIYELRGKYGVDIIKSAVEI